MKNSRIPLIVAGLAFALGLVATAVPAAAQSESILKDISYQKEAGRLVVLIKIEGGFSHEIRQLSTPPRLVMDFTPIGRIEAPPYLQIDDQGIVDVRAGQFQAQTARIVFDLGERAPIYSLTRVPGGLEISFRLEAGEPVKPAPKPAPAAVKPARPQETRPEPSEPGTNNFFLSVNAGAVLPLSDEMSIDRDFEIYGETGTMTHAYTRSTTPAVEVLAGKYFTFGKMRMKIGAGFSYVPMSAAGHFTASIPHPFEFNQPRTFEFDIEDYKSPLTNIFVFGLFNFVQTEKFGIWAGPVAGVSMGTYGSLEEFTFDETSPYASANISLAESTMIEEKVTTLYVGASLAAEYRISPLLTAVVDARLAYANPLLSNLGNRINLLQLKLAAGLQINL